MEHYHLIIGDLGVNAGGWTAPFVMVVKYSGKKRPVR